MFLRSEKGFVFWDCLNSSKSGAFYFDYNQIFLPKYRFKNYILKIEYNNFFTMAVWSLSGLNTVGGIHRNKASIDRSQKHKVTTKQTKKSFIVDNQEKNFRDTV